MFNNYNNIINEFKRLSDKLDFNYSVEGISEEVFFIGLMTSLMSNKKIFKKNKDLVDFLSNKFKINFPNYVQKSRPLIIGKSIKQFLENGQEIGYSEELNLLYKFISVLISNEADENSWNDIIRNIDI